MTAKPKILIIRFSSFGDVLMCMSIVSGIKQTFPDAQLHWIIRSDLAQILSIDRQIDKIFSFDRREGFRGLLRYAKMLKKEKYDYIYDAHCNLRSLVLKLLLCSGWNRFFGKKPLLVVKKKEYFKRFLLFKFRINKFPNPYRGMIEFQKPLAKWGVLDFNYTDYEWYFPKEVQTKVKRILKNFTLDGTQLLIALVPSAMWELKRWPVEHWKELLQSLPEYNFVLLGGIKDSFCEELAAASPENTFSLAGKTTLVESIYIIKLARLVISADTGLIHAADLLCSKGIVLRGPTAFGAPTGRHIQTLETSLPCRPCTKHGNSKCKLPVYKKCMMDILPESVAQAIKNYHMLKN